MLQPDKDKKSRTVFGKTPKPKSMLGRYVNHSSMNPDFSGDNNVSGGELAADMGMAAIGGGIIGKIAKSVGGKAIGKGLTRLMGSYFPSSGKSIAKKAASIVAKKRATLNSGGVIPKGEFGYGKAQNFANANKPSISTRTGTDVVENWKTTKGNAKKQLDEQLKKMKK